MIPHALLRYFEMLVHTLEGFWMCPTHRDGPILSLTHGLASNKVRNRKQDGDGDYGPHINF